MNRYWINAGLALMLSSAMLSLPSQPAHGLDAVYCTNCGTEWTQLMNKAMQVKQLATQAQHDAYLTKKMGANDWRNKYTQWSKEGTDNALYTLKGLGMHANQLQQDQALQQRLQAMAGSAQGRMEALQVANMKAAQNAEQLMKLRELMMMQLQMQANFIAQQQDRQAAQEAARHNYFQVYKSNRNGERF